MDSKQKRLFSNARYRANSYWRTISTMSHWDKLRIAVATPLVQLTVVMPILGYFILFSAEIQDFLKLTVDSDVNVVSWRLYLLYFGFSSLAISATIFNVRCPPEVKHHGAAYEFVANEEKIMLSDRIEEIWKVLRANGIEQLNTSPGKGTTIVMTVYFEVLEQVRPRSRYLVLLFYALGIGTLFFPTADIFVSVIKAAYRDIF